MEESIYIYFLVFRTFTKPMISHVCEILDVQRSGNKDEVVERLMEWLLKPEDSGKKVPKKRKGETTSLFLMIPRFQPVTKQSHAFNILGLSILKKKKEKIRISSQFACGHISFSFTVRSVSHT